MNNYDPIIKEIIKAYETLKTCENEVIKGELDRYITEQVGDLDIEYKLGRFNPTLEQAQQLAEVLKVYMPEESEK